jgi:hypothetical protein
MEERIVVSPKPLQVKLLDVDIVTLKGEKGDSYVLTESDKQEIASQIEVPIVEKEIIQRIETIKEVPIVTNEVVETITIKEDISPEDLRNKLESLNDDERLSIEFIKGSVSLDKLQQVIDHLSAQRVAGNIEVFNSAGKVGSGSGLKFIGATVTNDGNISTITITGGGGGSPGGSDTNIQYNDAGSFGGEDKFTYTKSTNTVNLLSDYGANLAPALTTGNWNDLAVAPDWTYGTSPDRLIKSATNNNFALKPSAATWVTAGQYYKIVLTITALSGGSLTVSIGGVRSQLNATTTGTFTFYITASDTSKFEINPNQYTVLCTITGVEVYAVTANTGELNAEGDISGRGLNLTETITSDVPRVILSSATNDDWEPGGRPRAVYILQGGSYTITGMFASQVNGQEMFLKNFSASTFICFRHQDTGSTAENRFSCNTSQDIYLQYGETLMCRYSGGTINRWLIEKISNSATQMSGVTAFQDYLNTLLVNAEDMSIGTGNAGIKLTGTTGITKVGDQDNLNTGTRTEWDDDNITIKTYMNALAGSKMQLIERGNDYIMDELLNETDFVNRLRQFASKFLLTDSIGGNQSMVNDTVLVEFRTGGDTNGTYRGMLIPSMSSSSAAGMASMGAADYLLYHDQDCRMTFNWDGNQSRWRSTGSYSGKHTSSPTGQTTFSVSFPSATMPDTNYYVQVTAQNALSATDFYVTNKSTTGFDIESINGLTGDVDWDWEVTY